MNFLSYCKNFLTLRALRKALIELSKNDAFHYETTSTEYANTRLALMTLAGHDRTEMLELESKMKTATYLEKQVRKMRETADGLRAEIQSKRGILQDINEAIESAKAEQLLLK